MAALPPQSRRAEPGLLSTDVTASPLARRFGLLQATALNMINMIGIGPFITIPLLMSAAMPGSGGTLMYLKNEYT